ncbi:MAG TPA: hypothetical protein VF623_07840, partial [Segetibacter sp.]
MKDLYKALFVKLILVILVRIVCFNPFQKLKELFLSAKRTSFCKNIFRVPTAFSLQNCWEEFLIQNFKKIKRIAFTAILLVVFFSTSQAQQLGNYPFTGLLLATCPNNNNTVTSQPANATFSAFTNTGGSCVGSTSAFINDNLNTNAVINVSEYNEFTVTPEPGYLLRLSALTLKHQTSANPSGGVFSQFALRSSIDNFAANIAVRSTSTTSTTSTINLPAADFLNVGAVTFRLYVINLDKKDTRWLNENVSVSGIVVKIPANPPAPTSNSPQCASPGVTLTRSGAPTGNQVWYWQATPTGTSIAKPEPTCTVTGSGTYYIRALDTVYSIWSTGAGSLSVTVTPNVGVPVFTTGTSSVRCQGAATVSYGATATNNTGITYSIDSASLAAGNTIDTATGVVTYTADWVSTSTITATATGCGSTTTAIHTATTNGPVTTPVFGLGATSVICQAPGNITYTATATFATGITYSIDAASSSGGNVINTSTGAVAYSPAWSGTTVITASAAGCVGPLVATHTVTITPSVGTPVFAAGATSKRCIAGETINYRATATTNTGITYSLDAASQSGGNTIDAYTGDVMFATNWSGISTITASSTGCNGPKTATHTVVTSLPVTAPVFNLTPTSARCQGAQSVTYTATANYTTGITYSLDSASLAGGNTITASAGIVNYAAGWVGTSIITATATGCNGPSTATHMVTITPT